MSIITLEERNAIISNMEALLAEYDYTYTRNALEGIIDEWASQKQEFITAFKRHPNYIPEEYAIVFSMDYERKINLAGVNDFTWWVTWQGKKCSNANRTYVCEDAYGDYEWTYKVRRWLSRLGHYDHRTIDANFMCHLQNYFPDLHFHEGEKTTRVVNKICKHLGIDKHPDYNKEYAKYADAMSPMTIKRHTIISLNPLDYLTMSFGNSWASCHTIDKTNKRDMPDNYEGMYSSGTISYMLDSASFILYTTDKHNEPHDFWKQPKITRQMFHWGEEKLVQGRLYPKDNDDDGEAYTPYRNLVQEVMATIFDFPNLWTLKRGTEYAGQYIRSEGTHYMDYCNYDNCTLSRIKDSENECHFTVGSTPICIHCGERHDVEDNINCCAGKYHCAQCGCLIDRENVIIIDGEEYCDDCVSWCPNCDEYYLGRGEYVNGFGRVCSNCADHFAICEECNELYIDIDDLTYVESEGIYVCESCLRRYFVKCSECG